MLPRLMGEAAHAVGEGQLFALKCGSSADPRTRALVTISRASTGGLFAGGLEIISKGNRFSCSEGDYAAYAVDAASGYARFNAGGSQSAVVQHMLR